MTKQAGYKGKVLLGNTTLINAASFDGPGITNDIIEATPLNSTFKTYIYGSGDGGEVAISGFYDEDDDAAQTTLKNAAINKTNITNLRLYYGSGASNFFFTKYGTICLLSNFKAPETDKSGVIGFNATLKVSDGYFIKAKGIYTGTDLVFANANPDTITKTGGTSFAGLGFLVGHKLTVQGSAYNNNAIYTIATVAADVLTLDAGDALTAENTGNNTSLIASL